MLFASNLIECMPVRTKIFFLDKTLHNTEVPGTPYSEEHYTMPVIYEPLESIPAKATEAPATLAGASSEVNPADSLDTNEMIIPNFTLPKDSLPSVDGPNSEMIGTILAVVLCLYIVKFILSVIPRMILIGIGAAVVYGFLR